MKVQNTKLLSSEIQLFDKESALKLSHLLTDTMKTQNVSQHNVLNDAISATKNFATVMISDKSDKNEKLTFLELLDQVSMIARSELQEGEQAHLSMKHLEVVMAKTSLRYPNASLVIPQQQQQERSSVLIQVKTAPISVNYPSIDIQSQIMDYPTETYITKCDTTLISPIIAVRFFDATKQARIDQLSVLDNDFQEPILSTMINVSNSTLNNSYAFVCKYHVTSNDTWTMDNRVCRTVISPHVASSVTCMCNQPVTHAVSLDYIQSTKEEENERVNPDTPCTNPCGCAPRPKPKLQLWAKIIIGISVSIVITVILILLTLVVWIIVRRLCLKQSFSRRITKRVELRQVDSPVMAIKFCWWWLC